MCKRCRIFYFLFSNNINFFFFLIFKFLIFMQHRLHELQINIIFLINYCIHIQFKLFQNIKKHKIVRDKIRKKGYLRNKRSKHLICIPQNGSDNKSMTFLFLTFKASGFILKIFILIYYIFSYKFSMFYNFFFFFNSIF